MDELTAQNKRWPELRLMIGAAIRRWVAETTIGMWLECSGIRTVVELNCGSMAATAEDAVGDGDGEVDASEELGLERDDVDWDAMEDSD